MSFGVLSIFRIELKGSLSDSKSTFENDITQSEIIIQLKNTSLPDLSGCEFTGPTLKLLALGLWSRVKLEPYVVRVST